jgi:hypothetical protein
MGRKDGSNGGRLAISYEHPEWFKGSVTDEGR